MKSTKQKKKKRQNVTATLHWKAVTQVTFSAPEVRALRVRATNEWMRRFIEEPERFSREWQSIALFQAEEQAGQEPSYGERCEAYLEQLMKELSEKPKAA